MRTAAKLVTCAAGHQATSPGAGGWAKHIYAAEQAEPGLASACVEMCESRCIINLLRPDQPDHALIMLNYDIATPPSFADLRKPEESVAGGSDLGEDLEAADGGC